MFMSADTLMFWGHVQVDRLLKLLLTVMPIRSHATKYPNKQKNRTLVEYQYPSKYEQGFCLNKCPFNRYFEHWDSNFDGDVVYLWWCVHCAGCVIIRISCPKMRLFLEKRILRGTVTIAWHGLSSSSRKSRKDESLNSWGQSPRGQS